MIGIMLLRGKNREIVDAGFTLLEVVIVTLIIGILLTLTTLSLERDGAQREGERQARRMVDRLQWGCERAILQGRLLGVYFSATGYAFYQWREAQWQLSTDDPLFETQSWPNGWQTRLWLEQQPVDFTEKKIPQVLCSPSGESTVFELHLKHESDTYSTSSVIIYSEGWGEIGIKYVK
ncbi:type II secretion system minor pseudopilin GspH [Thioflexithrix psekupsensis]|uniref:Type II secretion system protein H n=1 Tax=Thioflexithrix psekupsensis TaxID=1570016 RepID=A0A251X5J4_9GAMM|nr:type II secretion system minor pseudopilin GspH [Thioflexithrix psekupsensis]OUD12928.1 type II secretion system protein GspH [Thioflexithrix psekupsensis]